MIGLIKKYWRERSKKMLLNGRVSLLHPHKIARQGILDALMQARKYAHGRLLDIGCGDKQYEFIFRGCVTEYIGIDLPPNISVYNGEKKADAFCSALALPFEDNSFDTVLSTQTLEHVPEPQKMLSEAFRVLKKDGHFILTAPMTWGLHEIPYDYYRYTKYGLQYMTEKCGFKILFIQPTCGKFGVIGQKMSGLIYYFGGISSSLFIQALKRVLCAAIQAIALFIDKFDKEKSDTLDYFLVAKKI